ncbi:hypothetical protein KW843_15645 [Acidovorax sp. sif1233]|uniref:DUF5989 family protein n=1 Tax=unclassified Acidovorax TaxID=2684926 RepID=UPI001C471FEB|nr:MULTISPECIES: DUF5989 family protein [unclassified Acidovorax]MBV7428182.1 hypothetical protein [Acidovorax sp. sif0732]MBV7449439.1 hypothetical protein [Acidovorax sp. sif0715]MBV7455913.1 hypothetical protein [Acidovorax sp. sif1233]
MLELIKELILFFREHKRYVLIPVLAVLLLLGALLVFGQGSVIAPFIYTLF